MDLQAFCLSVCTCLLQAGSTPFLILLCKLLLHVDHEKNAIFSSETDRFHQIPPRETFFFYYAIFPTDVEISFLW